MIRLPSLSIAPPAIPIHDNCGRCTAICCNYVSTEIDPPTKARDYDQLRWYLMHPGVRVYVEDSTGNWFIQFMSRCRNLQPDNLCGIYETRPQICRDLQPTECEFALGPGDRHFFGNLEEFDRWMAERDRLKSKRRKGRTRRQPTAVAR